MREFFEVRFFFFFVNIQCGGRRSGRGGGASLQLVRWRLLSLLIPFWAVSFDIPLLFTFKAPFLLFEFGVLGFFLRVVRSHLGRVNFHGDSLIFL